MKFTKDFFIDLGFDFKIDLKSTKINFVEDSSLNNKLQNTFFFYSSPNQTNTSFYLITTQLSDDELITVRKYIWNQNEANLLFYIPNKNILKLLDAKTAPNKKAIELDTFKATEKDLKKIERIKKWRFDSGTFWINYYDQVKKAKHKSVDKILINTLKNLKSELEKQLSKIESDINKKDEVVQALIDRTLYVKYLEDNHIINSYFRKRYFGNEAIDYKTLLSSVDVKSISRLFEIIHKIFNNGLFHPDTIDEKYLTTDVCHAIETSLNRNLKSNQISLFDFQFDVIPVEFISYIYEIFLTKEQKANGIYYTPKKLAQLIVDDVIVDNKVGKVLDPACGSGMFLIVAFQKLLEISNEPENIADKIEFRT
ncbi:MAG: N-6 DNA methylase, partial [Saprospiraceae bacterium]